MDLPANALDMIKRFLYNESFADTVLPNELSYIVAMEQSSNQIAVTSNANMMLFTVFALLVIVVAVGSLYALRERSKQR